MPHKSPAVEVVTVAVLASRVAYGAALAGSAPATAAVAGGSLLLTALVAALRGE